MGRAIFIVAMIWLIFQPLLAFAMTILDSVVPAEVTLFGGHAVLIALGIAVAVWDHRRLTRAAAELPTSGQERRRQSA